MAPRGTPNSTSQAHRVASKCNTTIKTKIPPNTLQTAMLTRRSLNLMDSSAPKQTPLLNQNSAVKLTLNGKSEEAVKPKEVNNQRQPLTPLKQNKPSAQPGSVTKSGKNPTWSRRPKPAHSGVPVPEKMKKLFEKLAREGKSEEAVKPKEVNNQRQPLTPLKQNKPSAQPGSVTKSGKKPTWSRRPKPAHSGVPVPEKMKKLFEKLAREGKQL